MRLGLAAGARLNAKFWLRAAASPLLALAAVSVLAISPEETIPMAEMTASSPLGEVWRWTSLTGAESLDVVHPGRYTLELRSDGRYAVRADCNTGGGAYQMEESLISLSPGLLTRAACAPGSLGERFAALLGRVSDFRVHGDRMVLEFGDGAGAMEFEATKPIALDGTSWLVRGYNNGKGGVISVGRDATLYLTFTEDGKVTGSSGCNDYKGSFNVVGQQLRLGHIASTRKMCQGNEVMQRESAFLSALASVETWDVRGERLQLRRAEGALALDLVAAVTGTVTSSVPLRLPPDTEIRVSLRDISRMDVLATLIGEDVIHRADRTGPIQFQIAFDPAETDPRHTYGVRATIKHQGDLIYTSTQAYPVITRGAPRYGIEIQVKAIEP